MHNRGLLMFSEDPVSAGSEALNLQMTGCCEFWAEWEVSGYRAAAMPCSHQSTHTEGHSPVSGCWVI